MAVIPGVDALAVPVNPIFIAAAAGGETGPVPRFDSVAFARVINDLERCQVRFAAGQVSADLGRPRFGKSTRFVGIQFDALLVLSVVQGKSIAVPGVQGGAPVPGRDVRLPRLRFKGGRIRAPPARRRRRSSPRGL